MSNEILVGRRLIADERVTVSTTPVGGTVATYSGSGTTITTDHPHQIAAGNFKAQVALVECLTNGVYYTLDGGTPSGTNGHELAAGDNTFVVGYEAISKLRMVRSGGTDAAVQISYFV